MALIPSQNCVIKTITLQPGEPYNLPPGAELISATDINALTSTCPLPPNLEQPEYWVLILASSENDDSADYYSNPRFGIGGYELSGVYTSFSKYYPMGTDPNQADEGCWDLNDVKNGFLTIPGVFGINTVNGLEYEDGLDENGCKNAWTFKIIPSVAKNLYIVTGNSADLGNTKNTAVSQFHRLLPYDYVVGAGNYGWIPDNNF
jgi:hypothetical protein